MLSIEDTQLSSSGSSMPSNWAISCSLTSSTSEASISSAGIVCVNGESLSSTFTPVSWHICAAAVTVSMGLSKHSPSTLEETS